MNGLRTALLLAVTALALSVSAAIPSQARAVIPFPDPRDDQVILFEDFGSDPDPCESGGGNWDCSGEPALTRADGDFIVLPADGGSNFYEHNVTTTEDQGLILQTRMNSSGAESTTGGIEVTFNNGFTDIAYASVPFNTVGSFVCGDEASDVVDIPFGNWYLQLTDFAASMECRLTSGPPDFFSYVVETAECGGAPCDLTLLTKTTLFAQGGSDDVWVDYVALWTIHHEAGTSCEDFGFCGDPVASVRTDPADQVTSGGARLNGVLETFPGNAAYVDVWFQWGANASRVGNTDFYESWNNTTTLRRLATGAFSRTIGGLEPNTTYYFRAVANAYGTGSWAGVQTFSGGDEESLTTEESATLDPRYLGAAPYVFAFAAVLVLTLIGAWTFKKRYRS